jgi:hypothetical protein
MIFAEAGAREGADVTVVGLSSSRSEYQERRVGNGVVRTVAVKRSRYAKDNWARRLLWSLCTNAVLIARSWRFLSHADTIRFTGSPPFLLHFVVLANFFLNARLVYRITDFYPECIIAAVGRPNVPLELFRRFTNVVRRRVDEFETLGYDMQRRLLECGIPLGRMTLIRDFSPVQIRNETVALARPAELAGKIVLLYSGNWGVAHDIETFFAAYRDHHSAGDGSVVLWLNATGSGAEAQGSHSTDSALSRCTSWGAFSLHLTRT